MPQVSIRPLAALSRWLRDNLTDHRAIESGLLLEQRRLSGALATADAELQRLNDRLSAERAGRSEELKTSLRRQERLSRNLETALGQVADLSAKLDAIRDDRTALFRQQKRAAKDLRAANEALSALAAKARADREDRRTEFQAGKRLAVRLDRSQKDLAKLETSFTGALRAAADLVERASPPVQSDDKPAHLVQSSADGVAKLSRARLAFHVGEIFQAHGDLERAAAFYREAQPNISNLLKHLDSAGREVCGPDFLVIGAARTGTAWLKKHLAFHPQVTILAREQHYFSFDVHTRPTDYVARFVTKPDILGTGYDENTAQSGRRLYGEKSPSYLNMDDAKIALCAALFPELRLICIVREPISRAWSHVKLMEVEDRAEDLTYLRGRRGSKSIDQVIEVGRYREHLDRWARRFRPEQIHLVEFDQIRADPRGVYSEVLKHIGASPFEGIERLPARIGASTSNDPPAVLKDYLQAAYENDVWDIASLRRSMELAAGRCEPAGSGPTTVASESRKPATAKAPRRGRIAQRTG